MSKKRTVLALLLFMFLVVIAFSVTFYRDPVELPFDAGGSQNTPPSP